MLKSLVYAGLDFIIGKNGRIYLLEINDHPIALVEADLLAKMMPDSYFKGMGLQTLASTLANRNPCSGVVCLLLPDFYRIVGKGFGKFVKLISSEYSDDPRVHNTITEFNQLSEELIEQNIPCFISDVRNVTQDGRRLYLSNGEPIEVLFRRSYHFPSKEVDCYCVNELYLRQLCLNKLETYHLLKRFPEVLIPNTQLVEHSRAFIQKIENISYPGKKYIVKPVFGYASKDIKLITYTSNHDFEREIFSATKEGIWLIQDFIASQTLYYNSFEYAFDVRIYVIDGKPVAGFLRTGMAPLSLFSIHNTESPLSFLTTAGKRLPLIEGDWQNASIPSDILNEIISISRKAVLELEAQALRVKDDCLIPHQIKDEFTPKRDFIFLNSMRNCR